MKEHCFIQGKTPSRLELLKKVLHLFIQTKLSLNSNHEFAFCLLRVATSWVRKHFFIFSNI